MISGKDVVLKVNGVEIKTVADFTYNYRDAMDEPGHLLTARDVETVFRNLDVSRYPMKFQFCNAFECTIGGVTVVRAELSFPVLHRERPHHEVQLTAAMSVNRRWSRQQLTRAFRNLMAAMALHELDECLTYAGYLMDDPHQRSHNDQICFECGGLVQRPYLDGLVFPVCDACRPTSEVASLRRNVEERLTLTL